jgi:subtilase family serine protease
MKVPKSSPNKLILPLCLFSSIASTALTAGTVIIPESSIEKPEHVGKGKYAHTHFRAMSVEENASAPSVFPAATARHDSVPATGYSYQTPASIACIYGLVTQSSGCNPNKVSTVVVGGSNAIAIVDAYHYPNAQSDLNQFSAQFGLPVPNLTVVYANGTKPATSPNSWEVEEALDLQTAHAMAPSAELYLVEAASSSINDLLVAVAKATSLVTAKGGRGEVSMSWGASEFRGEANYDSYFSATNVVYFASSGDAAGVNWPCVSKNVVCVGGTTLNMSTSHTYENASAWVDTGGGYSTQVKKPSYQSSNTNLAGASYRGVPDIAMAADPNSGAWIFYTPSNTGVSGWWIVGGTSLASPMAAGVVNSSNDFYANGTAQLTGLYTQTSSSYFTDISSGVCGPNKSYSSVVGWDKCTGLGSLFNY